MDNSKLNCKTGLEDGIISKDVYNREIQLCKSLSAENGGKCSWGVCKDCGVLPLLHKLHKGKLLENPDCIKNFKEKILIN